MWWPVRHPSQGPTADAVWQQQRHSQHLPDVQRGKGHAHVREQDRGGGRASVLPWCRCPASATLRMRPGVDIIMASDSLPYSVRSVSPFCSTSTCTARVLLAAADRSCADIIMACDSLPYSVRSMSPSSSASTCTARALLAGLGQLVCAAVPPDCSSPGWCRPGCMSPALSWASTCEAAAAMRSWRPLQASWHLHLPGASCHPDLRTQPQESEAAVWHPSILACGSAPFRAWWGPQRGPQVAGAGPEPQLVINQSSWLGTTLTCRRAPSCA